LVNSVPISMGCFRACTWTNSRPRRSDRAQEPGCDVYTLWRVCDDFRYHWCSSQGIAFLTGLLDSVDCFRGCCVVGSYRRIWGLVCGNCGIKFRSGVTIDSIVDLLPTESELEISVDCWIWIRWRFSTDQRPVKAASIALDRSCPVVQRCVRSGRA